MKKILYFAIIACLTAMVSACSDDSMENPYATDDALTVVSNDAMIPSAGGNATIVVQGDGTVTAESSTSWCTVAVSGNTVTVSATPNNAIESRNATVTIKSGNKKTQVSVYQEGMVFVLSQHEFSIDDNAAALTTEATLTNSSIPVTVESKVDWISGSLDASTGKVTLNVTPNNTGLPRTGSIDFICNGYTETVTVSQFEFEKDVLGLYYFGYYGDSQGNDWSYFIAELKENELVLYVDEGLTFSLPVSFPNGSMSPFDVNIGFGNYVGPVVLGESTYAAYLGFDNYRYNFLGRYPQFFFNDMDASMATLRIENHVERSGYTWYGGDFGGVMVFDGDEYGDISNWYILAMTAQSFSQQALAGSLLNMYYPYVEKASNDEGGEAASKSLARRRAR